MYSVSISLGHYLALGAILFVLGIFGVLKNRHHTLTLFMSLKVGLLGILFTLLAFSKFHHHFQGQIFSLFVLALAGAEFILGLILVLSFYQNKNFVPTEDVIDLEK